VTGRGRAPVRGAAAAVVLALLVALAGCGGSSPPVACVAPLPAGFFGITAPELLAAPAADRRRALGAQHRAGARTLRQVFDWSRIETAPGRYALADYDALVGDAARAGLTVLPVLYGTPAFRAAPAPGRTASPPRDSEAIGPFARALVARYGPSGSFWRAHPGVPRRPARAWQIWNEPNLGRYWRGRPDAAAYAGLLRAASTAIRSVDPRAELVTAGLPDTRRGVRLATYLRQLYAAGARGTFDTVGVNLYARTPGGVLLAARRTRQVMARYGDDRARIWITELGWADDGPRSSFTVGRAAQARSVRDALRLTAASARLLRLRGTVYYAWKDLPPYPGIGDFWGLHTGLLDESGAPKPALAAFTAGASAVCSR